MDNPLGTRESKTYMPTLDGLRGVACLLVVFAHLSQAAHLDVLHISMMGSLGVLIFFSLSGFLMGSLYLVAQPFTEESAHGYIAARVSRIAPAYLISVVFTVSLSHMIPGFPEIGAVHFLRLLLFSGSALVFWSIPPEVQFYGFFFVLWFGCSAATRWRGALLGGLACVTAAAIASRTHWPGILLASKLHIFLLGVSGAYVCSLARAKAVLAHPAFQVVMIGTSLGYYLFELDSSAAFADIPFAVLIAVTLASLSHTTAVTWVLTTRAFKLLGASSFSIYLFHDSIIRVWELQITPLSEQRPLSLAAVAVLAIAVPSLFHVLVEKKINRKSKAFLRSVQLRPSSFASQ